MDIDGILASDPHEIRMEADRHFKTIFTVEHNMRPTFDNLGFNTLTTEKIAFLEDKFSHEEIDGVVASCDPSKAPGPDGFNFAFIKNAW